MSAALIHSSISYIVLLMCFGARLGCSIFHRLTQSVKRMMARRGYHNLIVYLDDFLIIEQTYEKGCEAQQVLIELLGSLGFLVSWHKVECPSHNICFLGVEIDTLTCQLRLNASKLEKLDSKLKQFEARKRASKR